MNQLLIEWNEYGLNICLENMVSKSFVNIINPILNMEFDEVILTGGRGSTKSSFYSLLTEYGKLEDYYTRGLVTHTAVIRKVANTLRNTVYNQFKWAINELGIDRYYKHLVSPLDITNTTTGQKIVFFGCDDPIKIKSTKMATGFFKYIIFEEFDQFSSMREVRNVIQSLARGKECIVFFVFNPPPEIEHWANVEADTTKEGRLRHHSTYEDVPFDWLGKKFFQEAEYLKSTNFIAYQNEYLGIATGVGGQILKNVYDTPFSDDLVLEFDHVRQGLDFGFGLHPLAWVKLNYKSVKINIFDQIFGSGIKNAMLADEINTRSNFGCITRADSEEPRAIHALRDTYGVDIIAAKKGPDSVHYGIKWLQDLERINIDKKRCPDVYRQFKFYAYPKDKNGNYIKDYPDIEDDCIDATRYALYDIILKKGWRIPKRRR